MPGTSEVQFAVGRPAELEPAPRDSRMARVVFALGTSQILMMIVTGGAGLSVRGPGSYAFHFMLGLMTALMAVLIHCVVLTYFTVTGKLVKAACEKGDLDKEYMERTLRMKTRTMFMLVIACLITVALVASGAFAALEWNRNLDEPGQRFATTHFSLMIAALLANAYAFFTEFQLIRRNSALLGHVFAEYDTRQQRQHVNSPRQ